MDRYIFVTFLNQSNQIEYAVKGKAPIHVKIEKKKIQLIDNYTAGLVSSVEPTISL
jgi:hypothetical protein